MYEHLVSDPQTARRLEAVESNGGRVCLVQLSCPEPLLVERVTDPHRQAMGKIATVELLRRSLDGHDVFEPIPGRTSLRIDTSVVSPTEAAGQVIEHYGLPRSAPTS